MNKTLSTFAYLFSAAALFGCKPRSYNSDVLSVSELPVQQVPNNQNDIYSRSRFHLITPTGAKIFSAIKAWENGQLEKAGFFAQPAMCAANASHVLEMAGVNGYSAPLLVTMVNAVKARGGVVVQLPKGSKDMSRALGTIFGGRIPVGSFVSGCLRPDCSGQAGDGHIALVGDIDESGSIKIYHNNWFRPDNNPNKQWQQHMIPLDWFNKGFKRRWMPTPWIYIQRDTAGNPSDVKVRLPEIDDLDPSNYFVTVSIPVELMKEVKANQGVTTDGKGKVTPVVVSAPAPMTSAPKLQTCKQLKVFDDKDPNGVNMRAAPAGLFQCTLANGTAAELLEENGQWLKVRAQCNGTLTDGWVFMFLTQPNCQMEK